MYQLSQFVLDMNTCMYLISFISILKPYILMLYSLVTRTRLHGLLSQALRPLPHRNHITILSPTLALGGASMFALTRTTLAVCHHHLASVSTLFDSFHKHSLLGRRCSLPIETGFGGRDQHWQAYLVLGLERDRSTIKGQSHQSTRASTWYDNAYAPRMSLIHTLLCVAHTCMQSIAIQQQSWPKEVDGTGSQLLLLVGCVQLLVSLALAF
jgi:hypothetical protein